MCWLHLDQNDEDLFLEESSLVRRFPLQLHVEARKCVQLPLALCRAVEPHREKLLALAIPVLPFPAVMSVKATIRWPHNCLRRPAKASYDPRKSTPTISLPIFLLIRCSYCLKLPGAEI